MSYRIFDASEIQERRKPVAAELGARAIKVNQFDSQPGQAGKEHDEVESGQEEIYVPVRGTGVLRIGDEEMRARAGPVRARRTRGDAPGRGRRADGLSYVVVGAVVELGRPALGGRRRTARDGERRRCSCTGVKPRERAAARIVSGGCTYDSNWQTRRK